MNTEKKIESKAFKKGDVVIVRCPPSYYGRVGVIVGYYRYSEVFGGHQWTVKFEDGIGSESEIHISKN